MISANSTWRLREPPHVAASDEMVSAGIQRPPTHGFLQQEQGIRCRGEFRGLIRFGIETSYRQMNQARIRTCTRDPKQRLLFVAIALLPRNVWAWFHHRLSMHKYSEEPTLFL